MIIAQFGTGQVFWSMLWFTMFFLWIWLVITVFGDIIRSADLSGWGKALWSVFILVVPYLGVFVYLVARGRSMQQRAMQHAAAREDEFRTYVQEVADTTPSPAGEVARLAELHDRGVLNDMEFDQAKARALA